MNQIIVKGNIGRVENIFYTSGGKPMLKFSLGDNSGKGDNKHTSWWNVIIFGDAAEEYQKQLAKGNFVEVSGRAQLRTYEKKDGGKGFSPDIWCDKILVGDDVTQFTALRRKDAYAGQDDVEL